MTTGPGWDYPLLDTDGDLVCDAPSPIDCTHLGCNVGRWVGFKYDEIRTLIRFGEAGDPWAGDLTYPLAHRNLQLHNGVKFMGYEPTGDDRRETDDLYEAQVVTSRCPRMDTDFVVPNGGWHYPVLDLDMPVHAVPSSTPGHSHLYIDQPMPWSDYVKLLTVMSEVGLLEEGYVKASIERGHTPVRLPWVKKWANDEPTTWAQLTAPVIAEDPWL